MNTPVIYDLFFIEELMALGIRIPKEVIIATPIITPDMPIIESDTRHNPKLASILCGDLKSDQFGFDGALKKTNLEDSSSVFLSFLPPNIQAPSLFLLSASFSMLFRVLETYYLTGQTKSKKSQLMLLHTEVHQNKGLEGWGISGDFSNAFCKWLKNMGDTELPKISNLMQTVEEYIHEKSIPSPVNRYSAWINDANLHITDDSFGLRKNLSLPSDMDGYRICSDNMDHVIDQILLMVALFKLYQLAREDGVGIPPTS